LISITILAFIFTGARAFEISFLAAESSRKGRVAGTTAHIGKSRKNKSLQNQERSYFHRYSRGFESDKEVPFKIDPENVMAEKKTKYIFVTGVWSPRWGKGLPRHRWDFC